MASERGTGLSALCYEWPLGDDQLREHLGIRLCLGMGTVPLWTMDVYRLLRLGLGTGLRVGPGLGKLAEWWRLLRLGTAGAAHEH